MYSKQQNGSSIRDFLVLFAIVVRETATVNEIVQLCRLCLWLPECSKLAINRKNDNDVTICRHDVIVIFFRRYFVSIGKFRYWSRFHVNAITGSGVENLLLKEIDQKSGYRKYSRLSSAQYLETGASQGYRIWQ